MSTSSRSLLAACVLATISVAPTRARGGEKTDEALVVARWYGTVTEKRLSYATWEPSLFGVALSSPNRKTDFLANVIFREEILKGKPRLVVEALSWSGSIGDLHYVAPDGGKHGAGTGGSGGGAFTEEQLAGRTIAASPETLAAGEAQAKASAAALAKARTARDAAAKTRDKARKARDGYKDDLVAKEKEKSVAEADYERILADPKSTAGMKRAATKRRAAAQEAYLTALTRGGDVELQYAVAESALRSAEDELVSAESAAQADQADLDRLRAGTRVPLASASVTYGMKGGRKTVAVSFNASGLHLGYGYHLLPLNIAAKAPAGAGVLAKAGERMAVYVEKSPRVQQHRVDLSSIGTAVGTMDGEGATATFTVSKGPEGSPGLIGGGSYDLNVQFRRVPQPVSPTNLSITGHAYHRVRVPANGKDVNVCPRDLPIDLNGAIPVAGNLQIEAWETDGKSPGKLLAIASSAAREFKLTCLPPDAGKLLRLRFVYGNARAHLVETCTIDLSGDEVLAALKGGEANVQLKSVSRQSECRLRDRGVDNALRVDLGGESRRAVFRRSDKTSSIEFNGNNALLLDSFVVNAPYLHQELHELRLNAVVPTARLVKAIPAGYSKEERAAVLARLPGAGAGETGSAELTFRGYVICFPTCVTMALGGLTDAKVEGNPSKLVPTIAQGIYDRYYSDHSKKGFPFSFPFTDPDPKARYEKWPFVDRDERYGKNNIQWLATLTSTGMRPWQDVANARAYLESEYGIRIEPDARTNSYSVNVFDGTQDEKIVRALGRGQLGILSIKHRDAGGDEGGHILVLIGAVLDNDGKVKRLILHDPYGDQTRNPDVEGYYGPTAQQDRDREGKNWGAFVPYHRGINSFNGAMPGKWLIFLTRSDEKDLPEASWQATLPDRINARLLPGD